MDRRSCLQTHDLQITDPALQPNTLLFDRPTDTGPRGKKTFQDRESRKSSTTRFTSLTHPLHLYNVDLMTTSQTGHQEGSQVDPKKNKKIKLLRHLY